MYYMNVTFKQVKIKSLIFLFVHFLVQDNIWDADLSILLHA